MKKIASMICAGLPNMASSPPSTSPLTAFSEMRRLTERTWPSSTRLKVHASRMCGHNATAASYAKVYQHLFSGMRILFPESHLPCVARFDGPFLVMQVQHSCIALLRWACVSDRHGSSMRKDCGDLQLTGMVRRSGVRQGPDARRPHRHPAAVLQLAWGSRSCASSRPSNPYTEPSMEIFSYSEQLQKWVEVRAMMHPACGGAFQTGLLALGEAPETRYLLDSNKF